ncbi:MULTISPECIES: substrate-binding domain-containing protein [Streptomyces]|uniref:Substrate-binding domain-containing protein n=1 Tax=Streptomyces lonegramiae TaxID=3075524 RepID=A0ABU2XJS2_9ACTN|nr:substrate-binding domain-containing protein [Streptomyces sp. DSM 41529]MDT0545756.1 substrate-binding domain-containing protein [Streptomyces sp. DSM 41529]
MRRIFGIVLAVLLIGGVAVAVVAGRDKDKGTATTTVRGVIGSEKAEFFADPDVVKALAAKGFTVKTETSGSWAMENLPLKGYDFAFPSSESPAAELARKAGVSGTPLRPFYSPLVVVAHRNAAGVLADNGLATLAGKNTGTLKMAAYLKAAKEDGTWQQLKGSGKYSELNGVVSITSTDPSQSNSGALYLAAASYVENGGRIVANDQDIARTAPLMKKLISVQGAQQSSSDAPFRDFISGAANPLVLVYESQVASLLMQKQDVGDMVVLYPDVTVNSDHTLVPLTSEGRKLGELLSGDKKLRELAVRHGFRPQGAAPEFIAATAPHTAYLNQRLTGVRQAPVPKAEVLRDLARRARS